MRDQPSRIPAAGELSDVALRRRRREEHSDPRSIAFLTALGISPHATCLEIGAGLGSLARWIAASLAPQGTVQATEIRPQLIQAIRQDAPANLQVVHHDVTASSPPGSSYDLIHARFVLEHLPARNRVLRSLTSFLSSGGWLVIEDALITTAILDGPELYLDAMASFAHHRARLGSDYTWARNLPSNFRQLGLGSIRAQRVADIFESGSDLGVYWAAVLQQEHAPTGASPAAGSLASKAAALLCGEPTWFSGPQIVQCAGQRAGQPTTGRSRQ